MENNKIMVSAIVNNDVDKVWDYYTNPNHIVNWNFADVSWHCPSASNDLKVGGIYKARMEAKDGSFGFDFEAIYTEVLLNKEFTMEFGGRLSNVKFLPLNNATEVIITFDPETENPIELQQAGWQAILNNFKSYTEKN
jgi:uncharacterized protein YndB with AHSA1/START domain